MHSARGGEKYVVRSETSSCLSVEVDAFPERAEKAVLAGVKQRSSLKRKASELTCHMKRAHFKFKRMKILRATIQKFVANKVDPTIAWNAATVQRVTRCIATVCRLRW